MQNLFQDYTTGIELQIKDGGYNLQQDIQVYKEYAATEREIDKYYSTRKTTFRPFCIVPDIVAIDIFNRYGIDIHSPDFGHDETAKRRFAQIMKTEFPELLTSSAANLTTGTSNSGGPTIIIK